MRWIVISLAAGASVIVLEAAVAIAAVYCGFFWGTILVSAVGILVTIAFVQLPPFDDAASWVARLVTRFRARAMSDAGAPHPVVQSAYRFGGGVGFVASSILLGPVVTIAGKFILRRTREGLWSWIVLSSLLFASAWVGIYSGVWLLIWKG